MSASRPQQRQGLAVERVDGELMVLDEGHQQLHCLSPLAAKVFEACDGTRTPAELAARLTSLPAPQRSAVVEAVLGELADKGLVHAATPANALSRRKVLLALGIAVPFVATVLAPAPAQAASCVDSGKKCKDHKDCCRGFCAPGGECL